MRNLPTSAGITRTTHTPCTLLVVEGGRREEKKTKDHQQAWPLSGRAAHSVFKIFGGLNEVSPDLGANGRKCVEPPENLEV